MLTLTISQKHQRHNYKKTKQWWMLSSVLPMTPANILHSFKIT